MGKCDNDGSFGHIIASCEDKHSKLNDLSSIISN